MTFVKTTKRQLKLNRNHWIDATGGSKPSDEEIRLSNLVFATHTFPFFKLSATLKREFYPLEIIFNIDSTENSFKGLLSDYYREVNKLIQPDEPVPTMCKAREAGLHHYVFGYLSIHDPFYGKARRETEIDLSNYCMPFGVFIKKAIECFPNCVATHRDLNSPQADPDFKHEVLLSEAARTLLAYQSANSATHAHDFWYQYGSYKYWVDQSDVFSSSSWENRIEMHFHEKIEVKDFAAVLWPLTTDKFMSSTRSGKSTLEYYEKVKRKYPECQIIPYELDLNDVETSFVSASFVAFSYYVMTGAFPASIKEAESALIFMGVL